jgi:aminoglycoside 2''-phosphotransferase
MELPGGQGREACLQALHYTFPELAVTSAVSIDDGWDNYVLEFNKSLIFRFPRRPDVLQRLATDVRLLPQLAKVLPLPIPNLEYIARSPKDQSPVFVGYPRIPGEPFLLHRGDGHHLIAKQLGDFLTSLHRFSVRRAVNLGVSNGTPASWRQEYKDLYTKVSPHVFSLIKPPQSLKIVALWETFLGNQDNFRFAPVLVHRDLSGENILWDPNRGELTGVIDWSDSSIGDPAIDFVNEFPVRSSSFTEVVLGFYQGVVDPTFSQRIRFYSQAAPFYGIHLGLETGQHEMVDIEVRSLQAMLANI